MKKPKHKPTVETIEPESDVQVKDFVIAVLVVIGLLGVYCGIQNTGLSPQPSSGEIDRSGIDHVKEDQFRSERFERMMADETTKRVLYGKAIQETYPAVVIRIVDADKIEILLSDNSKAIAKLESIDAPEKDQPFGDRAIEYVKALAIGKAVMVRQTGIDHSQTRSAFVFVGGQNLNTELIKQAPID